MPENITKHLALSVTTLGETTNAVIMEVGAVAFDPHGTLLGDITPTSEGVLYRNISFQTCLALGLDVDEVSVLKLLNREPTAHERVTQMPKVSISAACDALMKFCAEHNTNKIWCNHGGHAAWVMASAFKRLRKVVPWATKDVRCTSTLFSTVNMTEVLWKDLMRRPTRTHPTELAWAFARTIQYCLNEDTHDEPPLEIMPGQFLAG